MESTTFALDYHRARRRDDLYLVKKMLKLYFDYFLYALVSPTSWKLIELKNIERKRNQSQKDYPSFFATSILRGCSVLHTIIRATGTRKIIFKKEWKREIPLAERGFDPRTSGLWAQHASTAPLCYRRSREVLPSYLKRSCHSLCKAGVDRKCQDSFNSFAPRLKK